MTTYRSTYRAAIIGHTGRGNFGHGLDQAFYGLPNVETVAVADPDEARRPRAQGRRGSAAARRARTRTTASCWRPSSRAWWRCAHGGRTSTRQWLRPPSTPG